MKALALKAKNYSKNVSVASSYFGVSISNFLFGALGMLVVVYALMLGIMVFGIVERRSAEADIRTLVNEVGELELQYLSLSNKIDLELSTTLGFKETIATFATRQPLVGNINVANNDI